MKPHRGRMAAGLVLPTLSLILGCPPRPLDPGGPDGEGIDVQTVVDPAEFPTAIALAPDGRAFFTEKETGRVRVISAEGLLAAEPFATVPAVTNAERGALGVALHPAFAQNGYVYVFYTRSNTGEVTRNAFAAQDNRIVRFTAAGNVAAGPETPIFILPALPGPNHNGGHIAFGPDGKLYATIGDLTNSDNSQDINALAGRIHRLNDDGSIPADNPFGPASSTYALGLRNSFDLTFDPAGGTLFATENGTNRHDEVNRILAGANLGWPVVLGPGDGTFTPSVGTLVDPIVDYPLGSVVPTGIAFAPDDTFGSAAMGRMFVAQYATGRIIRYTLNAARDTVLSESIFAQGLTGGITDLEFAPDGTLYVVTTTQILRIVPAAR